MLAGLVLGCGGRVVGEVGTGPCASLEELQACGSSTIPLGTPSSDPCSWRVGLDLLASEQINIALDCERVLPQGCWESQVHDATFSVRFLDACCEWIKAERIHRIDIGLTCLAEGGRAAQ